MDKVGEMINKSLDQIDDLVAKATEVESLSKSAQPNPEDVSEDTPDDQEGEGNEGGAGAAAPEEGEPGTGGEPEDAEDNEGEPEEDTDEQGGEGTEKSLKGSLAASDNVRKALEVSEFLTNLVDSMSNVIDGQRADINKSVAAATETQQLMAKSFQGIAKAQVAILDLQLGLSKSMKDINSRLTRIEKQPQVRKSASSRPIEKSFANSSGGTQTPQNGNQLSKAEASTRLMAAFEQGDASLMSDILALEGTGDLNSISLHGRQVLKL